MPVRNTLFVSTLVLYSIILCRGPLVDAAALKRNAGPADNGGLGLFVDPISGPPLPGQGKDNLDTNNIDIADATDTDDKKVMPPPPPDTVNPPRKITFDYNTDFNFDHLLDLPGSEVEFEVGSEEDEEASQWVVVTPSGYEYDGSSDILREIFNEANLSIAGLIDDQIQKYEIPVSDVSPSFNLYSKRSVIGADDRIRVINPSSRFPLSAMGQVGSHCSGTFIGPRHVLTAAHCIYNISTSQWIRNLNFKRGKDCDPDDGSLYVWTTALALRGWTDSHLRAYDYGVIVVNRVSPTYMTYGWSNAVFTQRYINIVGYPGDKAGNCMWYSGCRVQQDPTDHLEYNCDTAGGMSGSAVYLYFSSSNRRIIYCVHAYGTSRTAIYNSCTRITSTKFEILQRWIRDY